jgi:hypothetical protein
MGLQCREQGVNGDLCLRVALYQLCPGKRILSNMAFRPLPFSNAGRYCDEKYNSSKQETEVLTGSSRKFRPKSLVPSFSQPVLRKAEDNDEELFKPSQAHEQVTKQSSMFVKQSREEYNQATVSSYAGQQRQSPRVWLLHSQLSGYPATKPNYEVPDLPSS